MAEGDGAGHGPGAGPPLVRPFAGLRPDSASAAEVAAPPYDVLTIEEARAQAAGRRWSFLHVSRPEIDFPPGTDPRTPEVYARAADNLRAMIGAGVLRRDPTPCFYVYRLAAGDHTQTGVAVAASIAAYQDGRIRRHELTRPDRETDRVRHIEAVGAQTGPVMAAHRRLDAVAEVVGEVTGRPPEVEAETADGVVHALWVVSEPTEIDRLGAAFASDDRLYIADGHHRSAAAARVAASRRAAGNGRRGNAAVESLLIVAFPAEELRILGYHRLVGDLGGRSTADFMAGVEDGFAVEAAAGPVVPSRAGEFGMYLEGCWHRLVPRRGRRDDGPPEARLDIGLLTDRLLGPVLGIGDPRDDPRIDFAGGGRGAGELSRRVDSGAMAVAFTLHPPSIEEVMAIADAGAIMPPKTTWFDPKLADGLLSLVLDRPG